MSDFFMLILGLAAGTGLGTFFFIGLWLTLRNLPKAQNPALLTLSSFFVRTAVSVFGFYLVVSSWGIGSLFACLAGFMLMRFVLVRRIGSE